MLGARGWGTPAPLPRSSSHAVALPSPTRTSLLATSTVSLKTWGHREEEWAHPREEQPGEGALANAGCSILVLRAQRGEWSQHGLGNGGQ